ncbi:cyclic nucleotide-binding domain protein (macronuclear) [Tetrahymena thermophila SB210]|uniref:Cyclic nucleotide-binding domain protein n=1 Tax=Tetrahymena thermophila (strain SB210) TaxID=312017 RepID=W7XLD8_TETTS|nr:cyclic nucleotide-binding domain protein [Tetrahymena thermophila SB210]EWS76114.1 cyclic nucleotide-binding domain protein [Tetrahymena thermophila SB210]|eukprot:XP_012651354.1 cyclic nucleotide-binding domain protein [Tetrahymena thermophila SB210]
MQQIGNSLSDSNDDYDIVQTEEEQTDEYLKEQQIKQQQQQLLNQQQKSQKIKIQQQSEQDDKKNDEKHLKALKLQVNQLMIEREVDVADGDIQRDFYILESHTYLVTSKSKDEKTIVSRRFSDFEWLHEELLYNFPGYFLPALPQKGIFSKIDPKIEFLNQIKSELMQERRQLLTLYLKQLLNHKELRFSKQLYIFLMNNEETFEQEKNLSMGIRQQKEKKKEGFISNIVNLGFSLFNKAIGSQKIEAKIPDEFYQEFQNYLTYYQNNYNKLKEISDSINQIIENKKRQAENMASLSSIFSELKKLDEIPENLDKKVHLQGIRESQHAREFSQKFYFPLQQLVGQLQLCVQIIQSRDEILKKIYELKKELGQHQNSLNQSEIEECKEQIKLEEKRLKFFYANFNHNQNYFYKNFNEKLEQLTIILKSDLQEQNKEILTLWSLSTSNIFKQNDKPQEKQE